MLLVFSFGDKIRQSEIRFLREHVSGLHNRIVIHFNKVGNGFHSTEATDGAVVNKWSWTRRLRYRPNHGALTPTGLTRSCCDYDFEERMEREGKEGKVAWRMKGEEGELWFVHK